MAHNDKLQKAIKNLSINDVYLRSSKSNLDDDFDPKSTEDLEDLAVQQMHIVHKCEIVQTDDGVEFIRIFIQLGARWIDKNETPNIKAFIEGEFIAEYQMKDTLKQEEIDEFALKNASYHIWPYWREYLSSQCERLRLPKVMLPMTQFNKN